MSDSDRKEELELLVMDHERVIEQYSALIQDQQRQIDRLRSRLEQLENKLTRLDESGAASPDGHEPPPHY